MGARAFGASPPPPAPPPLPAPTPQWAMLQRCHGSGIWIQNVAKGPTFHKFGPNYRPSPSDNERASLWIQTRVTMVIDTRRYGYRHASLWLQTRVAMVTDTRCITDKTGRSCYSFHMPVAMRDAHAQCAARGGTLTSPTDRAQNALVAELLRNFTANRIWLDAEEFSRPWLDETGSAGERY